MAQTSSSLVAVDLGASSGRVIAGRLERGRLRTSELSRFANRPVPVRGTLHWDVLGLWAGILDGLRAAGRQDRRVASVGIDTWAVDFGLLDGDGALLGNPVHYRDVRSQAWVEPVLEQLDAVRLYGRSGVQVQFFNTLFQLAAAAGSSQLDAAQRLLLMPDLLGYWLSGSEVCEATNASTTGMLDVTHRNWSYQTLDGLADLTGSSVTQLLAPIIEPGTVLGPVTPKLAGNLGLGGTQHVAVGTHDTASAVVGVPMVSENAAYISSGTWSLVGLEVDRPVLGEAARAANFTNELGVCGTVRFLKNIAGLWLLQESLRTWRDAGSQRELTELLDAARAVPARRCIIDVADPTLALPGDMPARIVALARSTGQPPPTDPAETVRCILDSLALAYRHAVRQAATLAGRPVDVVHVVGGGSRNALLCQLTADATGLPVLAGPAEGTAVGNLLVQAQAIGALDGGLAALREVVSASYDITRYEPTGTSEAWDHAETARQP